MRRNFPNTFVVLALGAIIVAALALRVALWRPFDLAGSSPTDGFTRVAGVLHVHTARSDGGGTPQDVIAAARAAHVGFVVITDHNMVGAQTFSGYHDTVLAIAGSELSTNAGHLLGLGLSDPGYEFSGDVTDSLEDIHLLGGVPIAAHPWSPRADLRWTGWKAPGPWGVEVMNLDSGWRRAGWTRLAWAALTYPLNQRYALLSAMNTPDERLAGWDHLLSERSVPGVAGTDAHARVPLVGSMSVGFPSYASLFSVAKTYVLLDAPLTGDASSDTARVLAAIAHGASYAALDALAPANGFSFTLSSPAGSFTMGDTASVDQGGRLVAGGRLPEGTRLTLLRDGHPLVERVGSIALPVPGPGVYRVEARLPGWTVPWILSNPIFVYDEAARQARAARAAWPPATESPRASELLDAFEGSTIFRTGADPSSRVTTDLLDPHAGLDGSGSGRLQFRLGTGQNASCEMSNRDPRNLTGRTGLVFSVRSDVPRRLWVQVRDANPALAEHTETWAASARTSTTWRRIAIPFTAFHSGDPKTDGILNLDQVRAIVFLLDRGAVKPGTSGSIWIDDVGVY